MFTFSNFKISTKLITVIALSTIIIVSLILLIIAQKVQQMAEDNAQIIVRETAYHYAYIVNSELERALDQARVIVRMIESYSHSDDSTTLLTRAEVNNILSYVIKNNDNFLGIYTLFEPNAFDGQDAEFIDQAGHDHTGRFIPYWSRNEQGQPILEPSVDYEVVGKGDYYLIPKEKGKEAIIEPYLYKVRNREFFVTSLVVPIFNKQSKFIGIAGVDLNFEKVQGLLSTLKLDEYETAFSQFYSTDGILVSHPDTSLIGQNVREIETDQKYTTAVLEQSSIFSKRVSKFAHGVVSSFVANLPIGNTGESWPVVVSVPEKELNNTARDLILQIAMIGGIAILVIIFIVYWMAGQISNSLNNMVKISQSIANGQLDNVITITRQDEVGKLLSSFQIMQTQLRERLENDQRIAKEVNEVISIASQGDFSQRISLEGKINTFKTIGEGINRILEFNQLAIKDLTRVFSAVAQGDLSQTVTNTYTGELAHLKRDANITVQKLTEVTEEITVVAGAASQGNFSKRIDLVTKAGTFKIIGESINQVLESNQLVIRDLTRVFSSVAKGDLTQTITNDYLGDLKQLKQDANTTVQQLIDVTEEIDKVTKAASQGDFAQRVSLEKKMGTFKILSENINNVLKFNQLAIKDLTRVFSAVSQGDLTQTITNDYFGELKQLKHDANSTVQKLTETLNLITQSADVVNQAAAEISEGNNSLSQRTSEQAASLEETASSMEQMTMTVQQNAENAGQASQLAASAKGRAEQGNHVVKDAILAIGEIHKSSKKITEIISVIDEIAFQTNLLALNAAVEAARAGDQGRGFAVVATEVRNLAQRSAAAAKEIKLLIQDSNLKVEEGTKLANQSGEALEELVTAVKKVNDIVSEIAAASSEQSMGIAQVNKAVSQMDEMVEQNSALVEQSMAASESMKEQAQILREQVAFFNMGRHIESVTDSKFDTAHKQKGRQHPPTHSSTTKPAKSSSDSHSGEWQDF